jgi:nicotinamidase/pyrazinamidase
MKALVIVDMQNDFMPDGALGVPKADEIVPIINKLIPKFPLVVATLDWHPEDHVSFVSTHAGKKAGDHVRVGKMDQILWPVHCVQSTHGAELVASLDKSNLASLFYKGTDKEIDSYSAFHDNARRKSTGLGGYLRSRDIHEIYLVGLTTEYCVLYSAMDAIDLGYSVYVIADACRPINLVASDEERSLQAMAAKGVKIIKSEDV